MFYWYLDQVNQYLMDENDAKKTLKKSIKFSKISNVNKIIYHIITPGFPLYDVMDISSSDKTEAINHIYGHICLFYKRT